MSKPVQLTLAIIASRSFFLSLPPPTPFSSFSSMEYFAVMERISPLVQQHKETLLPGQPQLNVCDKALMVSSTEALQILWPHTQTGGVELKPSPLGLGTITILPWLLRRRERAAGVPNATGGATSHLPPRSRHPSRSVTPRDLHSASLERDEKGPSASGAATGLSCLAAYT